MSFFSFSPNRLQLIMEAEAEAEAIRVSLFSMKKSMEHGVKKLKFLNMLCSDIALYSALMHPP